MAWETNRKKSKKAPNPFDVLNGVAPLFFQRFSGKGSLETSLPELMNFKLFGFGPF